MHTQRTQELTWFGKLPTSTEMSEKFHYKKQGDTIVHKDTLKKPKSQYTLTLSLTYKTRKHYSFFLCGCCQVFRNYSLINSLLLATYHKAHIYTCYFIKSAPGIPNTTCIRSISITGLGLVVPYGLVAKFKPRFTPH